LTTNIERERRGGVSGVVGWGVGVLQRCVSGGGLFFNGQNIAITLRSVNQTQFPEIVQNNYENYILAIASSSSSHPLQFKNRTNVL